MSNKYNLCINVTFLVQDQSSQTLADQRCSLLLRETEVLKEKLQSTREALEKSQGKNKQLKRKGEVTHSNHLLSIYAIIIVKMNTMLVDKQPRGEAIQKRAQRLSMVTRDVPPTTDPTEGPSTAAGTL